MTNLLRQRATNNPWKLFGRVLHKCTVGKMKYGRGDSYDAERYWSDRFNKYGDSLQGPGHEGLSEQSNKEMYLEAGERFAQFCIDQGVVFANKRVLEIGCGTGFYTNLISQLGPPHDFTGLDVTDVHFDKLQQRHPSFRFVKGDVTKSLQMEGTFDVVVMIDVLQHIVADSDFQTTVANVRRWLRPGGVFVISPISEKAKKELFYVRWWTLSHLAEAFPDFRISEPTQFRGDQIVAVFSP